ncbi:MAG: hypothetical protein KY410_10260, partial [Proteobacteria bacterium]|nr:hypothetical protein [Pseudomonadota bacterium]
MNTRTWISVAAIVSIFVIAGCGGGDDADGPVAAPGEDEVAEAQQAADCEVATPSVEGPADHIDPAEAPPADELYAERPAVGGQHFG